MGIYVRKKSIWSQDTHPFARHLRHKDASEVSYLLGTRIRTRLKLTPLGLLAASKYGPEFASSSSQVGCMSVRFPYVNELVPVLSAW